MAIDYEAGHIFGEDKQLESINKYDSSTYEESSK